jgi:hypothetical protein
MPDRPQNMYPGDRLADPSFDQNEILYCRVHPNWIQSDGKVDPGSVRCPDLSSSRSKYGLSYYVLYPRAVNGGHAVFRFGIDAVPQKISSGNPGGGTPTVYDVETVHDPCSDPGYENYAHCETRVKRDGVRMKANKVSPGAIKSFQYQMSGILKIERVAGQPFPP